MLCRTRMWLVVGLTAVATAVTTADESPPNVILLMGDDHGFEETSYNGHPHVQTPVLDEMAATGLRLDRFYSASPVCSPTRGSVLTGRHPNRYGTFAPNWSIRPEEVTIAHLLAEAGYACGHFGKWHLGAVKGGSPVNPGAMGFETWLSHDNFFEIDPTLSTDGGPPLPFQGESSEIIVAESIYFIRRAQAADRPFFAVIWFGSPHEPYRGVDQDLELYETLPEMHSTKLVTVTDLVTGLPTQRPLGDVLQERYAEITAMDRAIGQLREFLTMAGLRENTLLWYCGDNGIPAGGLATTEFRGAKGDVYEGGVRVPGILEWPQRIRQGRITNVNAVTSDMLPTICAVANCSPPRRPLDGINLETLIDGTMTERPTPICFWNYPAGREAGLGLTPYIEPQLQQGTTPLVKLMDGRPTRNFKNLRHPKIVEEDFSGPRSLVDNRYKLLLGGGGEVPRELIDLRADPAEQQNLVASLPEVAKEMEAQLREWQLSVLQSLTGADY